jgi:hypothetical protein
MRAENSRAHIAVEWSTAHRSELYMAPVSTSEAHNSNGMTIANITAEARRYAVRELGRRAGVTPEFLKQWRIEAGEQETIVYPTPGNAKRLVFPNTSCSFHHSDFHTLRTLWMSEARSPLQDQIPEFIIPFCPKDAVATGQPLFIRNGSDEVRCRTDLLASVLYSLSRVEELGRRSRDSHDRFPATESVAVKEGFLDRPIVDEYGFALAEALHHLLPTWAAQPRQLRVKVTHDIDLVGMPFSIHSAAGHFLKRRKPLSAAWDFLSLVARTEPAYLRAVREVVQLAASYDLRSATYWKASARTDYDSGYDPEEPRISRVIKSLADSGVELGAHPGYYTYRSSDALGREIERLKKIFGEGKFGGRQHYLRWHPDTWLDWENCGLAYDSSVGFAEAPGFRAGTAVPYRPWLILKNREARLLEIPLILMDGTLGYYMKVSPQNGYEIVSKIMSRCELVGGVFTFLWHNTTLLDPRYGDLYCQLLKKLECSTNYDWQDDFDALGV